MSEVKLFKTMIGMDYIGTLEGVTDDVYIVKQAYALMPQQRQDGSTNISFGAVVHPDLGIVDKERHGAADIELSKLSVVFMYDPQEELKKTYSQATTGIEIATQMPGNL